MRGFVFDSALVAKCDTDGMVSIFAEADDVLLLRCLSEHTAVIIFTCPKCGKRSRNVLNPASYMHGGSMALEKFFPARAIDLPPIEAARGLGKDDLIDLALTPLDQLYERITGGNVRSEDQGPSVQTDEDRDR